MTDLHRQIRCDPLSRQTAQSAVKDREKRERDRQRRSLFLSLFVLMGF